MDRPSGTSRREFNRLAALLLASWPIGACTGPQAGDDDDTGGGDDDATGDDDSAAPESCVEHDVEGLPPSGGAQDLPHLGGAPDTPEGRAIAALVDAVVPGRHRDPTGAPGGIDVGAPALFFDPELPAEPYVPLLVLVLDVHAGRVREGAIFEDLEPEEREAALETSLAEVAEMGFAVQLAKLAFFASAGAACHLGYPGANPGYLTDPAFTFGEAMSTEITADGNLD
ncbi:hypothetical protein L6R50_05575 [Myxococcota bacterium]|nr:hypothetical protein [Myxococcota bacterium]